MVYVHYDLTMSSLSCIIYTILTCRSKAYLITCLHGPLRTNGSPQVHSAEKSCIREAETMNAPSPVVHALVVAIARMDAEVGPSGVYSSNDDVAAAFASSVFAFAVGNVPPNFSENDDGVGVCCTVLAIRSPILSL